ncbi:MAG: formate dehydrogenase accessory sulfurtransferase FdhD [Candidatus Schekmanbacteria bacterium]|nr:formate dehydrogenase accessory sulfurtransferase FdhD [Candidatus Schekmanbacteria bacterium]
MFLTMNAYKLTNGQLLPSQPVIAQEEPLVIRINGSDYATLMSSPGLEKELAVGFCFSEGIINSLHEIKFLHHCGSGVESEERIVEVRLGSDISALPQRSLEVRSGCGICGRVLLDELKKRLSAINSSITTTSNLLFRMHDQMLSLQQLFKSTGGTHAAALFNTDGNLLLQAEDIGRHNALDKVIGQGLLRKITFTDTILLLTGRASYEMLLKTIRAGIPILASVSGTTNLAVQLAQALNCTLIGFLRQPGLEIYAHQERLIA